MCLQLLPIINIHIFLLLLCRFGHLRSRDIQVESRVLKLLSLRASWLFRSYLDGIYNDEVSAHGSPYNAHQGTGCFQSHLLLCIIRKQEAFTCFSCFTHTHPYPQPPIFPPLHVFPKLWLLHYFSFKSTIFFA